MFLEYKDYIGLTWEQAQSILAGTRSESETSVITFGDCSPNGPIAIVEFDLILAFQFLISSLAKYEDCEMDYYLSHTLKHLGLSFGPNVMKEFIKFRNFAKVKKHREDRNFAKTSNLNLYLKDHE